MCPKGDDGRNGPIKVVVDVLERVGLRYRGRSGDHVRGERASPWPRNAENPRPAVSWAARLRGIVARNLETWLAERNLGDHPVAALTTIFVSEVERLVREAAGVAAASVDRNPPRIGAISFLHRFGSALNRHVHLHVCVTDGVFQGDTTGDTAAIAEPAVAFQPARPITLADLDILTERVRRRLIRRRSDPTTPPASRGPSCWHGSPRRSHLSALSCGGDIRLIAFSLLSECETLHGLRTLCSPPAAAVLLSAIGGRPPAGAGSLRTGGSQAGEGQDGFARVKQNRHRCHPPGDRPPISVSSFRPMMIVTSCRPSPTSFR
jgi:hypothetical protein